MLVKRQEEHTDKWKDTRLLLYAFGYGQKGLKLDDKAIRVAVGLRIGLTHCIPQQCQCGAHINVRATHYGGTFQLVCNPINRSH